MQSMARRFGGGPSNGTVFLMVMSCVLIVGALLGCSNQAIPTTTFGAQREALTDAKGKVVLDASGQPVIVQSVDPTTVSEPNNFSLLRLGANGTWDIKTQGQMNASTLGDGEYIASATPADIVTFTLPPVYDDEGNEVTPAIPVKGAFTGNVEVSDTNGDGSPDTIKGTKSDVMIAATGLISAINAQTAALAAMAEKTELGRYEVAMRFAAVAEKGFDATAAIARMFTPAVALPSVTTSPSVPAPDARLPP